MGTTEHNAITIRVRIFIVFIIDTISIRRHFRWEMRRDPRGRVYYGEIDFIF